MTRRVKRSEIQNAQHNGMDTPTGKHDGYQLYPMGMDVGQGFFIGDMVMRAGTIGFLSNLNPSVPGSTKPFVFTTRDPKKIPKGYFSHGQFVSLNELVSLEDVDYQEVADLFGVPVEAVPHD